MAEETKKTEEKKQDKPLKGVYLVSGKEKKYFKLDHARNLLALQEKKKRANTWKIEQGQNLKFENGDFKRN